MMIAGMLLYWHWEAMVISYLAVKKVVLPYTSFEQLLSVSSDKVPSHQILSFMSKNLNEISIYVPMQRNVFHKVLSF